MDPVSLALAVAGGALIGLLLATGPTLTAGFQPGVLLVLGACVFFATYVVVMEQVVGDANPILLAMGQMFFGTLFALAPTLAPGERSISTTVGWMQQWSAVGQVSGPPLVAWVASQAGGWQFTWVVTGACCVAGALLAALIGRQPQRSA